MSSSTAERLVRGYSGRLLLTISVGWLAIQAGRLVLSPLLPAIKTALDVGPARMGFAFTVLWGLYALCQYPSGRLSDALSRKTLLVLGLVCLSVGFLLLGTAPTYLAFLGGAAIVGLGAGLYPTAARALVSDLFVEKRGRAFGLHTASGDLGGIAAAGLASLVLAVATWRTAFAPVVAVLVVAAVALHVWSREPYVFERRELAIRETLSRLFGRPGLRWLLVAYALYAFTWQATAGFLPAYLQLGKGFSPAIANTAFAVLFGVGAVVKPLAGGLGDRVPRQLLAPASVLLGAGSLTVVVFTNDPVVAVVAVVTFAAGLMSYPPVMQAYLMDCFPTESMGGDLGAMRTVYIGLGSLGPTYVGAVASLVDYGTAFIGLAAALLASATILLTVGRR